MSRKCCAIKPAQLGLAGARGKRGEAAHPCSHAPSGHKNQLTARPFGARRKRNPVKPRARQRRAPLSAAHKLFAAVRVACSPTLAHRLR